MRKCFVPIAAGALILSTILGVSAVSAADWRLALPTSTGLAFVDPSSSGSSAVTFSGQEFGQVDEVIATDENTRLMASISAVGGGTETILAFDTRSLQALGTTSFGSSMYGIIPNNTVVMPDGKSVVIVSFDGNLNYLDINTGKAITKAIALEGNPFGAVLSTDGSTIFVGLKEEGEKDVTLSLSLVGTNPLAPSKKIVFGKVKYTEEEVEYRLQVNGNKAAAFTPGAAFIADLSTGKAKKVTLTYNKKSLTPIGMSADGKTLICRYGDGATGIFVADASTGKVTKRILMKDPAYSMNSADGSLIYVSSPTKATLGVFDSSNMDIVSSYSIEGLTGPVRILKDPTSSALPVPKAIGGNIVIVGDNILGGAGDAKETFATLLAKKLSSEGYGIPVINSCSAEATAAELAEGFEGSVNEYNPKLVVIELGNGDLLAAQTEAEANLAEDVKSDAKAAAISEAQTKAAPQVGPGLESAIGKAVKAGLKVVLVCPPSDALKPIYEAAAAKYSVPMVIGAKAFKGSLDAAYPAISQIIASSGK